MLMVGSGTLAQGTALADIRASSDTAKISNAGESQWVSEHRTVTECSAAATHSEILL